VMLWEAIACRHMHGTATVYEILRRLVQGELPQIRDAVPDVPEQLEQILARVLSLKPEDRYPDAGAFREDLVKYLAGRRTVTTREIGERVSQIFALERREINEVIRRAMTDATDTEFSSGQLNTVHLLPTLQLLAERASSTHNTGPTTAPTTVPSTGPPLSSSTAPPVQMVPAQPPSTRAQRPKKIALVAAGALGLALLLGLFFRGLDRPGASPQTAAAPSGSVTSVASPSSSVQVRIRAHPENAVLMLDGKPLGNNPYAGAQARAAGEHELQVAAPGYEPRVLPISLERDVDLEVGLLQTQPPTGELRPSTPARKPAAPPAPAAPRARAAGAVAKSADTEPYRDLPARRGGGPTAPPLDTSESPW
jgi:hypothetical protein